DTMADIMGYQLTYTQHSGVDQQPLGVSSPAVAPYGAFPTRDGQTVVLGTTNDREWQRLAREIIVRPDLADDPRFSTNADRCAHRRGTRRAWADRRRDHPAAERGRDRTGLRVSANGTLAEALANEARVQLDNFATADSGEAYAAFAATHEPEFTGRWAVPQEN